MVIKNLILNNFTVGSLFAYIYRILNFSTVKVSRKYNKVIIGISFLKKTKITVNGKDNTILIGGYCRLVNCKIIINGDKNKVILENNLYLQDLEIVIEDNGNAVSIGDKTTIYGKTHLACIEGTSIIIGKDCMFSANIDFRTGDSHSIIDETGKRINLSKDISIGDHVWIGNKVIIMKGTKIGNNSLVGTGSIVTKSFDQTNVIIAGSPAKIIKERTNWLRERIKIVENESYDKKC